MVNTESRSAVQEAALDLLLGRGPDPAALSRGQHSGDADLVALLRFRALQLVLAADRIAVAIRKSEPCDYLRRPLPRDLVRQVAGEIYKGLFELYREDGRRGAEKALDMFDKAVKLGTGDEKTPGNPSEAASARSSRMRISSSSGRSS